MKRFWIFAVTATGLALGTGTAQAGHGCGCDCYCPVPPAVRPTTYSELIFNKVDMKCTEDVLVCKEVEKEVKCCEMVPVWKEQKKCCTVYHKVPRVIEKEVVSCHMVAECVVDPCTGCTKTCYKPQTCVKKVCCTVYDCVAEQKETIEKVCCMEPREKIVKVKCKQVELQEVTKTEPVTVITLERYKCRPDNPCPACTPVPCCAPAPCSCCK
jgi:hypothetical protein